MSCSRRASRRRNTRQRSSGIQTASSSLFHNRLASVRASSLSVLARALLIPVSSGLTTITRFTCGSRSRATSQQLPVTSNATRSVGSRLAANAREPLRRARHPPRGADPPVLADRDHTKIAVHIQADRSTHPSDQRHCFTSTVVVDTRRENQRENDTDRYELEAQSRQVAGAAERKARARSPSPKTAYPSAFSQRRPLSRINRTYGPEPDGPSKQHFHAATGAIPVPRSDGAGVTGSVRKQQHSTAASRVDSVTASVHARTSDRRVAGLASRWQSCNLLVTQLVPRRAIRVHPFRVTGAGCFVRRRAAGSPRSESSGPAGGAIAFAQQEAVGAPATDYRFARPDVAELTIELATGRQSSPGGCYPPVRKTPTCCASCVRSPKQSSPGRSSPGRCHTAATPARHVR